MKLYKKTIEKKDVVVESVKRKDIVVESFNNESVKYVEDIKKIKVVEGEEEYPEITEEMEDTISYITESLSNEYDVLIDSPRLKLQLIKKDVDRLTSNAWLSDDIVNFYIKMVVERPKAYN